MPEGKIVVLCGLKDPATCGSREYISAQNMTLCNNTDVTADPDNCPYCIAYSTTIPKNEETE